MLNNNVKIIKIISYKSNYECPNNANFFNYYFLFGTLGTNRTEIIKKSPNFLF